MRRLAAVACALALVVVVLPGAAAQDAYHNYESLKEDTRQLAEDHPDIARFRVVGESVLGLEIFAVDVAREIGDRSEAELSALPALYVDGGHHGNEILGMEAAYYFLEDILTAAADDPAVLEGKRLTVTPVVNPDGFVRDQRQNTNGVDLNRNYPFHWGRYGTSSVPGHFNYRGMAPASEPETRANMELMREMNLQAYLSGHTGSYDIVLPWRESEDGSIPDWPMYGATLGNIEDETGLEYRDPSGAGESTAWAYGNLTPFSVVMEVSREQGAPASAEDVRERLAEPLAAYRLVWENLTHLGASLHVEDATDATVTLHNDGWAPAYNVTAGGETVAEVPAGETLTLNRSGDADAVEYRTRALVGEEPARGASSLAIPSIQPTDAGSSGEDEGLPVPGPGPAAGLAAALGAAALRRGRRRV